MYPRLHVHRRPLYMPKARVSIVYAHVHVQAQQYDRTAHRSSLQQLANPVNHNVMSIQFDILAAVS